MAIQEAIPGMEDLAKPQTALTVIDRAILDPSTNADQLAKLLEVKLRYEADEARKAFNFAYEQFKKNLPEIFKTKKVSFPTSGGKETSYSHAELDKITPIITEALLNCGIVHSWETGDISGRTSVTCILSGHNHDRGKTATLSGPPDTSGGKNNVQAIGSTTYYLQRYTLLAVCGIAPKGMDDDGKTEGLPESTITDYCIQMQDSSDFADLKKVFGECWDKAKKAKDSSGQERFRKVYEERKKELAR